MRKSPSWIASVICLLIAVSPVRALAMLHSQLPPPAPPAPPSHLEVGDRVFDAGIGGFRKYLETKRASDPLLFNALDPRLTHLESRVTATWVVLGAAVAIGTASVGYAILGRKTCAEPRVGDPAFATEMDAWGACNDQNQRTTMTFGFVGVGVMALGAVAAWIVLPSREDLLDLVNAHNSLGREQMHLQIGYDPPSRLATSGIRVSF